MDYLERLDEVIEKVESALNDKSREHSPEPAACRDAGAREKKLIHRTAVRKVGSRAVRFTIRRSESEDITEHNKVKTHASLEEVMSGVTGTASKSRSNIPDVTSGDSLDSHKKEDLTSESISSIRETTLMTTYPSLSTQARGLYPNFHHTTISRNHNPRFSKRTIGYEIMTTQIPSLHGCTPQDKHLSKKGKKDVQRPRFALRSLRNVLSRKVKDSELSKFQKQEANILKALVNASQQRQAVIRTASSSLCTTEANEAAQEILQIDRSLIEEIGGVSMHEEKDRLDLLMEEMRRKTAEIRACPKIGDGDNEEDDGICHDEFRFSSEAGHGSSDDLDSESIMEFERAIVRCFISLSKEEINDVVKKYMMISRNTADTKEIKAALNDRVFRNCLGLRVVKSAHCTDIKTVIKKLDEYRRFVGTAVGIISRGNLEMDERFIEMITGSIGQLQRSSDPFTCKIAVQSMLSRRYVKDFVKLKKLLAKFSSLDI